MMRRLTLALIALLTLATSAEAAKLQYLKGSTSVFVDVFIQDSSSTTGAGLAGLVFNSASLVCYYARADQGNAGGTAITLASATLGTYTSGGFKEKDATNMPGVYEIGLPTGVLATGSNYAIVMCKGATNMAPLVLEVQLAGIDIQDAVRAGLTGLANATPGAAGGLFIAGTNAPVVITGAGTALTLTSTSGNGAGLAVTGQGSGAGVSVAAGATGKGLTVSTTAGDAVAITPTAGSGVVITANGTSKHGLDVTGGTAGTSDGFKITAGTGGVGMRVATGITVDACTGCSSSGGVTIMPEAAYIKASTSVVHEIFIKDSATNLGKTGLTNASGGLTIAFGRSDQGNAAYATCAVQAATRGGYTSCGFVEKDATNAPGWYELGLTTSMLATGADYVTVSVYGVAGTTPTQLPIALIDTGLAAIYSRLGAPAGASMSADTAAVQTAATAIKAKTDSLTFTGTDLGAIVNNYASGKTPLQPTTAGRTLNVTAAGNGGLDWATIENAGTANSLSGTTISTGQTIATVTTATNLTNAPANGDLTATMKTSVTTAATAATPTAAAVTGAVGSVTGNVTGTVSSIANAVGTYRKNVTGQRKFPIYMRDSGSPANPKTGLTLTVTLSKDGGAFAAAGGTAAEVASGYYTFAPSQADTNCDLCIFRVTGTGAVDTGYTIHTAP